MQTVKAVAQRLAVSECTVRRWIRLVGMEYPSAVDLLRERHLIHQHHADGHPVHRA